MAVLSVCPHAHEELNVVEGPRATLEMAVGAVEWWGVGSRHADVALVVPIEICPGAQNVVGTTRMPRKFQTDLRDEEIEAFLSV